MKQERARTKRRREERKARKAARVDPLEQAVRLAVGLAKEREKRWKDATKTVGSSTDWTPLSWEESWKNSQEMFGR